MRVFAGPLANSILGICWLVGDLDRRLLVDTSHGRQLESFLDDVVGGAIAVSARGGGRPATKGGDVRPSSLVIDPRDGCDGVAILPPIVVAEDVVVTAVVAGFGVDEKVLSGQGVHEHIDESRARHHGS